MRLVLPSAFFIRLILPVLIAVSVLTRLTPTAHAEPIAPRQFVTIPFTSLPGHGHIVVRIRFNDKLTGNFLLDTGAFASLMDETFARKLGIKMARTVRLSPVSSNTIEIYDMTIDQMRVGDLSLRNVHMLVVPHKELPKGGSEGVCAKEEAKDRKLHPEKYQNRVEPLDLELDGILGMDYLREFAFFVDFEHRKITAWAYGDIHHDELASVGMENATIVPVETDSQHLNAYFVNVGFETAAGRAVEREELDTGAEGTMMTPHLADKIKVDVKAQYFVQTFYGCLPFSIGDVDTIDLGGVSIPNARVGFTRKAPEGFPLLLGYDVFSRCRVLFDFPAKQMYVEAIPNVERFAKPLAQYSDPLSYTPGPNGEIVVAFQFDGGKTGTFALDTGADRTVISPSLAARLNLTLAPLLDASGSAVQDRNGPLMAGKLPVMRFGGTGVSGFNCAVASAPISVAGTMVDGVLGDDFFSAFLPYIDFQKHQVTFLQGRSLDGLDFEKIGLESAAEIPLDKQGSDTLGVPVEIKQRTALEEFCLVSTLDPTTILSSRVSQGMNFKTSGPARQIATASGPVGASPVTLDEFAVSGFQAPDGLSVFLQTDAAPLPQSIIGLDLLSHYRVLFDFPSGRLYLANPSKADPVPSVAPSAATPAKS